MDGSDVRRYDLPYGAPAPAIVNPEAGVARLLARGDSHSYDMTVTVLDAPDHRLMRAGVILAHRLVDGVGEWYLSAPDWQPHLPAERVEAIGEDLPEHFSALITPFRRSAALGPVAGLECRRAEYIARSADGERIAVIRDERVTVTRAGLTTARYREVTITPTAAATSEQISWMDEAIVLAGGAQTVEFPSFVARLGAPATGASDLTRRRRGQANDTMEAYVQAVLSAHLRAITAADLAVRAGEASDLSGVFSSLRRVRRDLRGLYPVLEPTWLGAMLTDVDEVLAGDVTDAPHVALSETYLSFLDRLVQATRAPRLGDVARRQADEVMAAELKAALATFASRADALGEDSTDEAWEQTVASGANVAALAAVCRPLLGRKTRQLHRRVSKLVEDLEWCAETSTEEPTAEIEELSPVEAFHVGRLFERDVLVQSVARDDFLHDWRRASRKLSALAPK